MLYYVLLSIKHHALSTLAENQEVFVSKSLENQEVFAPPVPIAYHFFFFENQEGGLSGFYFTKICQALNEIVKLNST